MHGYLSLAGRSMKDVLAKFACFLTHCDAPVGGNTPIDLKGGILTPSGAPVIDSALSKFGGAALKLDGNSYLTCISQVFSNIMKGKTWHIELQFCPTQINDTNPRTLLHFSGGGALGFHVYQSGRSILIDNGSAADYTSPQILNLNTFSELAFGCDGVNLYFCCNGVMYTSRTIQDIGSPDRMTIGRYTGGSTGNVIGVLDEICVAPGICLRTGNYTPRNGPIVI